MTDAWCLIGNFNTIVHKDDRIRGDAITVNDLREMQNLMDKCELAEMRSSAPTTHGQIGPYGVG